MADSSSEEPTVLSLNDAVTHLLEECRTVLPGIQALFGFQMVAVFNARFSEALSANEQRVHLLAIAVVVVAIALVMAPAALHRQMEPRAITQRFMDIASRLLMWSMVPLALGICLDVYLVARVIVVTPSVAMGLAVALLVVFAAFWLVLPRSRVMLRTVGSRRARGLDAPDASARR